MRGVLYEAGTRPRCAESGVLGLPNDQSSLITQPSAAPVWSNRVAGRQSSVRNRPTAVSIPSRIATFGTARSSLPWKRSVAQGVGSGQVGRWSGRGWGRCQGAAPDDPDAPVIGTRPSSPALRIDTSSKVTIRSLMADVVFVLLTLGAFAVLTVVLRAVEKL